MTFKRIVKAINGICADTFKNQLLNISEEHDRFILLDSNNYEGYPYSEFGFLCAFDSISEIEAINRKFDIQELTDYHRIISDWTFGYISYESLHSDNDTFGLFFFQPRFVFFQKEDKIYAAVHPEHDNDETINTLINQILTKQTNQKQGDKITLKTDMSFDKYQTAFKSIQQHIRRGDTYEVNFCINFKAKVKNLYPVSIYKSLINKTKAPFSAFLKKSNIYVLSASPERFLKHTELKLIAQPMKGTAGRGKNQAEDIDIQYELSVNTKERAENIMITDLVRNDLSRFALRNSVCVEELCKVYKFENVFQMITTVSSKIQSKSTAFQALKAAFPPGSMTGAPKHRTMQIIKNHETFERGLYSGSIGYITPEGNFDFSVVIRTLFYNSETQVINFAVGSAITDASVAGAEYAECLLKAETITKTLES